MAPRKSSRLAEVTPVVDNNIDDDSMDVDEDLSGWPQVRIRTSDGKRITLTRAEASCSNALRTMIESFQNTPNGQTPMQTLPEYIPLKTINSQIFSKISEWCQRHCNDAPGGQVMGASNSTDESPFRKFHQRNPLGEWDRAFIESMSEEDLLRLMHAANYLDISSLMDALCQTMARKWEGSKVEDIRKMYNIQNDLPPDQEHQMLLDIKNLGFDN